MRAPRVVCFSWPTDTKTDTFKNARGVEVACELKLGITAKTTDRVASCHNSFFAGLPSASKKAGLRNSALRLAEGGHGCELSARDGYVLFVAIRKWGGVSGSGWCSMRDDKNGQPTGNAVHRVKVVFNGVPAAALRWTRAGFLFWPPSFPRVQFRV